MSRKALILGIGGQDGYYLTNLLYRKGYEVWGMFRPEDVSEDVISGLKGQATVSQGIR